MEELALQELGIDLIKDIHVLSPNFYLSILSSGLLGLGESYMRNEWVENDKTIDELSYLACSGNIQQKIYNLSAMSKFFLFVNWLKAKLTFFPDSRLVALKHYNISNDLYQNMLGRTMNYSCALFSRHGYDEVHDLDSAQERKMKLLAKKLHLKPGMRVLDIGCGFGSLASFLAEHYKVNVTGVTNSINQYNYAKSLKNDNLKFIFGDYREINGEFDAIVSVGMFEHVNSHGEFMKKVDSLLVPGGIFVLHTIANIKSTTVPDAWISKYIFPNSLLPSLGNICVSSQDYFVIEDVENLSTNYDKTLMAWHENFVNSFVCTDETDEIFFRMWKYYLLICAGSFRARKLQLYQVVLAKQPKQMYDRI
jgi:cyclopropane-fatty-acyl-phospholipid synthase